MDDASRAQPVIAEGNSRVKNYLKLEPVLLAALTAMAILFFLAVTGLSRLYHAQQESLGDRWFGRGVVDLRSQRFGPAMLEFRTALRYSRDNYDYQLNLAEALLGLNRTNEARSYLVNLWEREPENGLVNLELARIAARSGQTGQAQRYYHNAIYATWPGNGEEQRRETRIELIEFLLRTHADEQAESELIALEANLGSDSMQQARLGDLFMRANDYDHALSAYRASLHSDRRNRDALAGAGWAAFETGQYSLAQRYLQAAISAEPNDEASATRLKITNLVLQMDPYQRGRSVAHRNRLVVQAFNLAGARLQGCSGTPGPIVAADSSSDLSDTWNKLKPRISERGLERDPDLVESAMDLVFEIERATAACPVKSDPDQALLLIANMYEAVR